jgi:hypothetical protein
MFGRMPFSLYGMFFCIGPIWFVLTSVLAVIILIWWFYDRAKRKSA